MKSRLFLLIVPAFLISFLGLRFTSDPERSPSSTNQLPGIKKIGCGPDWNSLKSWLEESDIPLIPGAGTHKWTISTTNDSAQIYFNQGMNMYYSFHIIESMASFKKAARFDSTCAMLHWAQALAYGPNINDGTVATTEALASEDKAVRFSVSANEREQILIAAMKVRYSADSTVARDTLNQLYTSKMREAYSKFPDDPDISALYVDAMMLEHPWDLWTNDGKPKPWTPLIRETLENLLLIDSVHPGANHYYIHVMEPSPFVGKALPSANRLGRLTPALAHTVHMPSHIYLRTGNYPEGVTANKNAIGSYYKMIPLYSAVTGNDFLYLIHNVHMETNLAMMAGDMVQSVEAAAGTSASISKEYLSMKGGFGNAFQYAWSVPILVDVRFERWASLLQRKPPGDSLVYARLLDHFGRGMAHAGLGDIQSATSELTKLQLLMHDSSLHAPFPPFSPAIEGATTAEQLLAGTIYQKEKKTDEAIKALTKAVETESKMVYSEPRDWMLNPRPYLGNLLVMAGQPEAAERVFMDDFAVNNNNFWSQEGLKKIRQ